MKRFFPRALSLLLSLTLLAGLAVPIQASQALGDGLNSLDTLLNQQTQLSTNVFWSTVSSDYRTENLITYAPNASVTPIVTYGGVLTDRSTVSNTAKALEDQGHRVVAGINGDFYNVNNGLPIGIVVTQGQLRSSDGGYHAIGFRADGSAILGKPAVSASVFFAAQDGTGEPLYNEAGEPLYDELGNLRTNGTGQMVEKTLNIAAVNKARTEAGIFLYTYDFNAAHTTGSTQPGVDVICSLQEGRLSIGETASLLVEQVVETQSATALGPNQVVLTANAQADISVQNALRAIPAGTVLTLSLSAADPAWNDVEYAVGSLYSLVENGAVAGGLQNGAAPRTAVGQRYDGSLIFYTIDGRKPGHSIGATMAQVAQRLIELGCVTGLCLDGGGSTTLTVTKPTEYAAQRINRPSEGSERAVSNQVFLVASNQPTGQLSHFYVSASDAYVLAGSSAEISAAAIDTNYIPMDERYELTASAGTLEDGVLTTPLEGGDITVSAQGGGGQGSVVVHAIANPDGVAIRDEQNNILTTLTAAPGTQVQLHGSAAYHRMPLKADPASFTWAVEGEIGSIGADGLFTAGTPGKGRITVFAGGQSASIDVTVSSMGLQAVEDFEGETTSFDGVLGENMTFRRSTEMVKAGRGSGRLDYALDQSGRAAWHFFNSVPMNSLYTQLNLWVYGDGSGNTLSFLLENGEAHPVTALDFEGWKQVTVTMPASSIWGVEISGTGSGAVYLDQLTATYDGIVDAVPPVVSLQADPVTGAVSGSVSDGVDGIPKDMTITCNGAAYAGGYDPDTGRVSVTPAASSGAVRVTVTAKDASGNIGRGSVDIPASGTERRFRDTAEYWGADYCDFLYDNNISKGYEDGTFRPDNLLTRLDFSYMLYNALKLGEGEYKDVELPFADLKSIPDYALAAVRALYAEGIVTGTQGKDGKLYFNPGGNLTRAQASAMIGRSQEKGYPAAELAFSDAGSIPEYARFYIGTMVSQGILSGYSDGTFRPGANITRGQMAKILYTLL